MKSGDGPLATLNWAMALAALRDETGVRQKEIAHELHVRPSTVSRWFAGTDVPKGEKAAQLRAYLEKHVAQTNKPLIQEIATTDRLMVLMDSKSNMISMSSGLMAVMMKLGIETWKTSYTEDGLLRIIEIKLRDGVQKSWLFCPFLFNYFDILPV
jgi:transcriptional regulator with XRE-family HTH domain